MIVTNRLGEYQAGGSCIFIQGRLCTEGETAVIIVQIMKKIHKVL
jgi:hypothetical protein